MEKPWVYHSKWSPSGSPSTKTLGACGPSGFGLGTSLWAPFTMIHPWLFHILSHCIERDIICWTFNRDQNRGASTMRERGNNYSPGICSPCPHISLAVEPKILMQFPSLHLQVVFVRLPLLHLDTQNLLQLLDSVLLVFLAPPSIKTFKTVKR